MTNKYIDHIKQRGYSPLTIKAYSRDLTEFFNSLPLLSEQKADLAFWSKNLKGKPATVNRKIQAVKSYYAFCKKFGYLDVDPSKDLAFRKKSSRLPKFLVGHTIPDDLPALHFAALTLLSETGLRLAELTTALRQDLTTNSLKITGKGNKERIIPISPRLYKLLALLPEHDLLIPLARHQVQYLSRKYLHCNPHTLRHTFATTLINAGAPLLSIKELLGHASVQSTEIYTHLNFERLKEIHQKCHPKH